MRETVIVAMSGGVDSSVAALLLKEQGYAVRGVCMRTGSDPRLRGVRAGCFGRDDEAVESAGAVARLLSIPLDVVDMEREYRERVLRYFTEEYERGRTPNPCVLCNPVIKFGALVEKLSDCGRSFDRFATGHYAVSAYDPGKRCHVLRRGVDRAKDQSYFLYRLTQEQLALALFPLGRLTKTDVRAIARQHGLPAAGQPESQDFLPGDRLCLFSPRPGPIEDSSGRNLGTHSGIELYTVGQRKGLGIASGRPLYVLAVDALSNRLVVGGKHECYRNSLTASGLHWTSGDVCTAGFRADVRIRSSGCLCPAMVSPVGRDRVRIAFDRAQWAVTPGQSAVFYRDDIVVGGAVIDG